MADEPEHAMQSDVRPTDILSGLGALPRSEICTMIALLEAVDGIFLAAGAMTMIRSKIGIGRDKSGEALQANADALAASAVSDGALRHRLWTRMSEALSIPTTPPLSSRHATKTASALAVRASERLSPSLHQRRAAEQKAAREGDLKELVGAKAADLWKAAKNVGQKQQPLPFPEVVVEELLNLLADKEVVEAAAKQADPEIRKALRRGHEAAIASIAAGGSWATFAVVVANAGFAPYILAAQASAFIPLIGGPALVSLLATLVSPVTVVAGVAAIGWLGMGKGSTIVRSQVAARMSVLLAVSGVKERDDGLEIFLTGMRHLDREGSATLSWMKSGERAALRRKLAAITGRLRSVLPSAAIAPPTPWNRRPERADIDETMLTGALTAGEMLWHATAISPRVIAAADFSRTEDLGDTLAFAARAQDFAVRGADISLRGYTAERLVLDRLIADGHDAKLAETSTTPGYDLIVDGAPVQVKCGTSLSILTEHFEKYPDIPVIANVDLASLAEEKGADWAVLVTTLPGYEISSIEAEIAGALGHSANLADPDVFGFAISIGVLRGGVELARGRIPLRDLPAWLLLDGASRGVLTAAGGKAGAWFGLIAIGPAGALVLGPAIAAAMILGNGNVKGAVQGRLMRSWMSDLLSAAGDLHSALVAACDRRVACLQKRVDVLRHAVRSSDIERWLVAKASDDLIAALEDRRALDELLPTGEAGCLSLLFMAPQLAPAERRVLEKAHALRAILLKKPGLNELMMLNGGNAAKHLIAGRFGRRTPTPGGPEEEDKT